MQTSAQTLPIHACHEVFARTPQRAPRNPPTPSSLPTWDIWGLKLMSLRSMEPGERLCSSWHSSTPSRSACARSKTTAEGQTTRWLGGKTLQSINHRPHCRHSSMAAAPLSLSAFLLPPPPPRRSARGCSAPSRRATAPLHRRPPSGEASHRSSEEEEEERGGRGGGGRSGVFRRRAAPVRPHCRAQPHRIAPRTKGPPPPKLRPAPNPPAGTAPRKVAGPHLHTARLGPPPYRVAVCCSPRTAPQPPPRREELPDRPPRPFVCGSPSRAGGRAVRCRLRSFFFHSFPFFFFSPLFIFLLFPFFFFFHFPFFFPLFFLYPLFSSSSCFLPFASRRAQPRSAAPHPVPLCLPAPRLLFEPRTPHGDVNPNKRSFQNTKTTPLINYRCLYDKPHLSAIQSLAANS